MNYIQIYIISCNFSKMNFYTRIRRVARNNGVFQKPLETTLDVMYVVIY
jgi:hypothetical protein